MGSYPKRIYQKTLDFITDDEVILEFDMSRSNYKKGIRLNPDANKD